MKVLFFIFFTMLSLIASAQDAMTIHRRAIVIDAHNDVLSNQLITGANLAKKQSSGNLDLVRAKEGGLDAQVFSIWCGAQYGVGTAYTKANREIDSLYALINRNPGKMELVRNSEELERTIKKGKFAAMIGVEGGHMIEDKLNYIDSLAKRGMCYMTLTWTNSTSWATSVNDEMDKKDSLQHLGLNDFGRNVIKRMNKLGVMVDVSHVGEQTFKDVMAVTTKPVIASHSSAYSVSKSRRNLKDYQLEAIARNGGVAFVNFFSGFLDSTYAGKVNAFMGKHRQSLDSLTNIYHDKDLAYIRLNEIYKAEADLMRPPFSQLIKHIDYLVKLVGVDHVGLGSDFDGSASYPLEINSVSDYPKITAALVKLGYSEKDIDKILGGNFIRVLKANTGK